MWLSYLHLHAKRHLLIFKYDEIINILARPPSDFLRAEKRFHNHNVGYR